MGICPYRQSERGIRGGWEEAGTLAPRAATVLWELACKFPEFPHINFRTVLETEEAGGRPGARAGSFQKRDSVRERLSGLDSLSRPVLVHEKVTRGTGRGQAPCRARAQATGQKVAGPEVSVPTDLSVRCQGA